jgi:AhpD family alkylhydroperoxidase
MLSLSKEANAMDEKVKELISIAASVAAGCPSCLATHLDRARAAGVPQADIESAVAIARGVRLEAVMTFDSVSQQAVNAVRIPVLAGGSDCGCGGNCDC